jgi:hypothetical protein
MKIFGFILPPSQPSPTGEGVQFGFESIISPLGEIRKGVTNTSKLINFKTITQI